MVIDEEERLKLSLGGLLYAPAANRKISKKIKDGAIQDLRSVAFCLEDSIDDGFLEEAERILGDTLSDLSRVPEKLPSIFIRIRSPRHMERIAELYKEHGRIVTGFILPKFDLSNMDEYIGLIRDLNKGDESKTVYIMPILESRMVADIGTRVGTLMKIKEALDTVRKYVLNVRVGGNDFCNLYGLRRSESQTIYDIGVVRDILVCIINIFAADYVVSGPVWEYFGTDEEYGWRTGLSRELELDRLNGFIGKTAIHPSQLPLIHESMKVNRSDYEDAMRILDWDVQGLGVAKSESGNRMNEVKVHGKWARRVYLLSEIYGIKGD